MPEIKLNYKGLNPEDYLESHTPAISAQKAKGTFYEAWFETLKSSPWYRQMGATGIFGSNDARRTWELFGGNLDHLTFEQWWVERGYLIFAEPEPYKEIQEVDLTVKLKKPKDGDPLKSVFVEIPLNLTPQGIHKLVDKFLQGYGEYQYEADRWSRSNAPAHMSRDSKLNPKQIIREMKLYRKYEKQKRENNISYEAFAIQEHLNPAAEKDTDFEMRTRKLRFAVNDLLKRCRKLMAYATTGIFPPDNESSPGEKAPEHSWTQQGSEYYIPNP
jgi:hypothetical protein